MTIRIKPSDLITRFLWDTYVYFCVDKNVDVAELIRKDEEFEISEKDAFVCGLLCVLYTDEVLYKFKQYLKEVLQNKYFSHENIISDTKIEKIDYINKQVMIDAALEWSNKIPANFNITDIKFKQDFDQSIILIQEFIKQVNAVTPTVIQNFQCIKYAKIKKIINKIDTNTTEE